MSDEKDIFLLYNNQTEKCLSLNWNRHPIDGVSYFEHKLTLLYAIMDVRSMVMSITGCIGQPIYYCGGGFYYLMESLPEFKRVVEGGGVYAQGLVVLDSSLPLNHMRMHFGILGIPSKVNMVPEPDGYKYGVH